MLRIYHNPRCSKSRQALTLVRESGKNFEVVEYLKTPPSKEELKDIVKKLGVHPEELVRKNESIYKESFKGKDLSDEQWLEILSKNPKLIERPIVIKDDKAVVGRPPEAVKPLL